MQDPESVALGCIRPISGSLSLSGRNTDVDSFVSNYVAKTDTYYKRTFCMQKRVVKVEWRWFWKFSLLYSITDDSTQRNDCKTIS